MSEPIPFTEFPKIARLSRECIVTEKIDGTNGCIFIGEDGAFMVGSRTRWITPADDNYGFAKWAYGNREELIAGLGAGRHFGEWWGCGIQRGYSIQEKRFSLFNAIRWCVDGAKVERIPCADPRIEKWQEVAPACCDVVPVLFRGDFCEFIIHEMHGCLSRLECLGSMAAPGFMKPEGFIAFHIAGNVGFKRTIEKDAEWKGKR